MRRVVSRILLVALAVAVAVAVWRVAAGGRGGAVVALDGLHAEALAHEAFRLRAPARLAVDAAGSFEERRDAAQPGAAQPGAAQRDTALAAFGWIVRRADRTVVWRQRPGARPARGLVSATRDTVALPAGTYDAYFASYGDPLGRAAPAPSGPASLGDRVREALSRGGRAWQGEAGRWHLRLTGATPADRALAEALAGSPAVAAPDLVWQSGPLGSRRTATALVRVSARTRLTVDAVLEATAGVVADSAAVIRVGAVPDTVWAFGEGATSWAGGSVKNRHARATLRLDPGLYRVSVRTDGTHAADDWTANPPFAPWAWGVRLAAADRGAVSIFDADAEAALVRAGTSRLPVLAEMRCVGTSQSPEVAFTIAAPTDALVVAQGELGDDEGYDFATLARDGRTVWTMRRDDSEAAGGLGRNRRAARTLVLAPGRYTLRFRTDDSHDCEDDYASGGSPDDAAFWGAAVVALDPAFDVSTLRRTTPAEDAPAKDVADENTPNSRPPVEALRARPGSLPDDAPGDEEPTERGETIIDLAPVGRSTHRVARFALYAETRVRVVATGELLASERLDYGWIQNDRGERVWEMTRANTVPAGGAAKNRRYDGVLTLEPGQYRVGFLTNGRHDADGFDGGAPDDPAAWGIRLERLGE